MPINPALNNLSPILLYISVALAESEKNPSGVALVHSDRTNVAADPTDLVELARVVQKVSLYYKFKVL